MSTKYEYNSRNSGKFNGCRSVQFLRELKASRSNVGYYFLYSTWYILKNGEPYI